MPAPYSGRCLCGGVNFTVSGEPVAVLSCFCEHCRKGAGGPNQVIAKMLREHVTVSSGQDLISLYALRDTTSGSPKEKAFCKICGASLWTIPAIAKGEHLMIRTALLTNGCVVITTLILLAATLIRSSWMQAIEGTTQWEEIRKA